VLTLPNHSAFKDCGEVALRILLTLVERPIGRRGYMVNETIDIEKSSRHQKIIGNMGEHLVCNWLSRSGFEVAIVDHTGIDLIAYDAKAKQRIGITAKSRTRNLRETESVNVFNNRKNDRKKIRSVCKAFGCEPWIAIYVETKNYADLFMTSLTNYDAQYRTGERKAIDDWKMSPYWTKAYDEDPKVMHLHLRFEGGHWFEHPIQCNQHNRDGQYE
jgi:Holliday junction resolvase-like predicted endonuclease